MCNRDYQCEFKDYVETYLMIKESEEDVKKGRVYPIEMLMKMIVEKYGIDDNEKCEKIIEEINTDRILMQTEKDIENGKGKHASEVLERLRKKYSEE